MEDTRIAFKILIGNPNGRELFEDLLVYDNIKIKVIEVEFEDVDWIQESRDTVLISDTCEHNNEFSRSFVNSWATISF